MEDKARKEFFEKAYREIFPVVIKVSYHITKNMEAAQDVCQEAFIKFYHRSVPFPNVDEARYWLIRVVKNLSLNYLEREKLKSRTFEKMVKSEPVYTDDTGERSLLKKETAALVNEALEKLPEKLKTPVILREFGGMNYKDIAKVLGISESNVKIRIFRGREALENLLNRGEVYVP